MQRDGGCGFLRVASPRLRGAARGRIEQPKRDAIGSVRRALVCFSYYLRLLFCKKNGFPEFMIILLKRECALNSAAIFICLPQHCS